MKRVFLLALAAFASLVVSCNQPEENEIGSQQTQIDQEKVNAFVAMTEYGLYDTDLAQILVFDKKQHEMVWNTKASRFIIQDDAQMALLTAVLTPSTEESHYSVSVTAQSEDITGTYTMKMVKSEGEAAWLWDVENELGIVVLQ